MRKVPSFLVVALNLVLALMVINALAPALAEDTVGIQDAPIPRLTLTLDDQQEQIYENEPLRITIHPQNGNTNSQSTLTDTSRSFPTQQIYPDEVQPAEKKSQHKSWWKREKKHEKKHDQNGQLAHSGPYQSGEFEISGVTIVDIHTGRVMPITTVDLKPTLERISKGIKNPHQNDGSIFRNLSHKLPRKSRNYYREYVVPTKGIRGPGPQRLIIGEGGEIYYTGDHYETFVHVERE